MWLSQFFVSFINIFMIVFSSRKKYYKVKSIIHNDLNEYFAYYASITLNMFCSCTNNWIKTRWTWAIYSVKKIANQSEFSHVLISHRVAATVCNFNCIIFGAHQCQRYEISHGNKPLQIRNNKCRTLEASAC